jgi:hypothetical protein
VLAAAVLCGAWLAPAASAQDTVTVGAPSAARAEDLPREVADDVISFYNRSTTIRLGGRIRIPPGRRLEGDVAIIGGPVELAGRVHGDLAVINGDLTLDDGARVDGDLTVVGGRVEGVDSGSIGGELAVYGGTLRYRRTADGIEYVGTRRGPRPGRSRLELPDWSIGDSEIYVSGRAYNRVEGFPIAFGPRIRTGGRNPLRIEALLVYRSERGLDVDDKDVGYEVNARQYLGGYEDIWIEAGVHSLVDPIESWQLTNLENSLALFLFRRDYRDYYDRTGWAASVGWSWDAIFGSIEFRDERHETVEARTPWTIFFNTDDAFQPNARIDGGDLQSLAATVGLDTRNDPDHPWSGWLNRLRVERSVGGDQAGRELDFTHFFADLRRYTRVSPGAAIGLRFVAGGRAGGAFMPAQREHVIGGVGTLPGYEQRQFDCGIRSQALLGEVAGYGCQRFALFQAEYRGDLDVAVRWDDDSDEQGRGDILSIDFDPDFVFFYNAGAAWNTDAGFLDHLTTSDNWVADVGGGLELGDLGVFLAYPLAGSGGLNFFVRLGRRF